jgi:hypothetical protein
VVYLPQEKIVVAGDLVVYPIPYIYDGYPVEWIQTLENLAHLDADTIVPGHGPVMHNKVYIYLLRDLMTSAVDQMNEKLRQTSPAMNQTRETCHAPNRKKPASQMVRDFKAGQTRKPLPRDTWSLGCTPKSFREKVIVCLSQFHARRRLIATTLWWNWPSGSGEALASIWCKTRGVAKHINLRGG